MGPFQALSCPTAYATKHKAALKKWDL